MLGKHSSDFGGITNVAHRGSIVIVARHTRNLLRKFRRLVESADHCTTALLLRVLAAVLVTVGILAVTATVAAVIYERLSVPCWSSTSTSKRFRQLEYCLCNLFVSLEGIWSRVRQSARHMRNVPRRKGQHTRDVGKPGRTSLSSPHICYY